MVEGVDNIALGEEEGGGEEDTTITMATGVEEVYTVKVNVQTGPKQTPEQAQTLIRFNQFWSRLSKICIQFQFLGVCLESINLLLTGTYILT